MAEHRLARDGQLVSDGSAGRSDMATVRGQEVQGGLGCQHHWLIDSPNGPVSRGICRVCGEEREFLNYLEKTFGDVYLGRPAGSLGLATEIELIRRLTGENKDEERMKEL